MSQKNFFVSTFLSLAGFGVLTIANFVYSIVTVRYLSTADFAVYNTFFYFLLAFPLPSFQLAVAKAVSGRHLSLEESMTKVLPSLWLMGVFLLVLYLGASPLLWYFYGRERPWLIPLGLVVLETWVWLSGIRGVYQGGLRFGWYSVNLAVEGIARLLIGFLAVVAGLGAYGALGASIGSGLVGIGMLLFPFLFASVKGSRDNGFRQQVFENFLKSFAALLPFGLIVVLDQTVVNRFVPEWSGVVNLSSLFGKNLIALSLTVAYVMFTYVVKSGEDGFLKRGMVLVSVIFVLAWGVVGMVGKWLFSFLFGSPTGSEFLPWYIVYCFPLGLLQMLVNYGIAIERKWLVPVLWGYLGIFVLFLWGVMGRLSLIQIYILITVVHFVFVLILFLTINKRGNVQKAER